MSCSILGASICPAAMIIGSLFTAASLLLWIAAGIMIYRRSDRYGVPENPSASANGRMLYA